jgi:predicted nucleotidyltransferase
MRLRPEDQQPITQAAREVFAPGTAVLLFGSRTDDRRRGGDVDLLIETPAPMPPAERVARRTRFITKLYRSLDEQRIDAVITTRGEPDARPVVALARNTGVLLAQL